jgi:hypothetical protein
LAAAGVLAVSCGGVLEPSAPATPEPSRPAASGSALGVLDTLPVKPEVNSPPYRRDSFGPPWDDVDDNGCDTRNDILARDLTQLARSNGCVVAAGRLDDPYTGDDITFNRARGASAVQIDHVVSLSDAWRTGASQWTAKQRLAFANDPENLLAVDGPENQRKGDDDASEWLPPVKGYRCPFIARQVGVKARYGLWVESGEKDAMRTVLATCPDQPVLGG